MECQECQQRPATLHFTQLTNNNLSEIHVCEVCAKEKGYMTDPGEGYSLHNLLAGLFSFDKTQIDNQNKANFAQLEELCCPKCKMTFTDFKRVGKFGCATCYQAFASRINPILRRVHSGNTAHDGKIPKRKGGNLHAKRRIVEYKEELQQLIKSESFEEAAKVRDKIKSLKDQRNTEAGDQE